MNNFLPSSHSFGDPLAYGATWSLWNVFTKAGRAENKEARAENARAKAKASSGKKEDRLNRKADRLDMRSANLKKSAEGGETIAPTFANSEKLWNVKYPWTKREKRKGWLNRTEVMRYTAKGHQPAYQLINQEFRATIVAGLFMLKNAFNPQTGGYGYSPFTSLSPESLSVRAKGTKEDKAILAEVAKAAKALKIKPPGSLKLAAGWIKDEVSKRGLASAAWSQRALLLVGSAMERASKTTKAVAVVGAALATAAGAAITIATAGAAAPAAAAASSAAVGAAASAGTVTAAAVGASGAIAAGAAGGVGAAKAAKLGGEWSRYEMEVNNALADREHKLNTVIADRAIQVTEELQADIEAAAIERQRKIGQFLGFCLYGSVAIVGIGILYRNTRGTAP